MERVEYEWPADCLLASSWRASVRLLYIVYHLRVESISVTASLRSKPFRTQRAALLWTISTVFIHSRGVASFL